MDFASFGGDGVKGPVELEALSNLPGLTENQRASPHTTQASYSHSSAYFGLVTFTYSA